MVDSESAQSEGREREMDRAGGVKEGGSEGDRGGRKEREMKGAWEHGRERGRKKSGEERKGAKEGGKKAGCSEGGKRKEARREVQEEGRREGGEDDTYHY